MGAASAAISTVSVRLIMCAWAVTAPSCSGFTIGQIGGIMGTRPELTHRRWPYVELRGLF